MTCTFPPTSQSEVPQHQSHCFGLPAAVVLVVSCYSSLCHNHTSTRQTGRQGRLPATAFLLIKLDGVKHRRYEPRHMLYDRQVVLSDTMCNAPARSQPSNERSTKKMNLRLRISEQQSSHLLLQICTSDLSRSTGNNIVGILWWPA